MFLWTICPLLTVLSRRYQLETPLFFIPGIDKSMYILSPSHSHFPSLYHNLTHNLMNTTVSYICMRVNSDSVTHRYDVDTLDNGTLPTDKGKTMDKSAEDLSRSASNSPTHSASKASKAFTVRWVSNVWWFHVKGRLLWFWSPSWDWPKVCGHVNITSMCDY